MNKLFDNKNILALCVGDKYDIPELGEGTVIKVLSEHYEIYFKKINKLKLISKNGKDLSYINVIKQEKSFEADRDLFLNLSLQLHTFPKRVKLCLEAGNIKTEGDLINTSDDEIKILVLQFEETKQQHIINFILKEKKKSLNILKHLEKIHNNPPKSIVYKIPKEERQYFIDKEIFINEHQTDKEDYYEEMYWENDIKRCRYINKNEITYEPIHKIDNEIVKLLFFQNLKKEKINDCPNPDCDKSLSPYQYWHYIKANSLIGYLVSEFDDLNYTIQIKLQKIIHQTVKKIKNNSCDFYINEMSCSLLEFKKRFELLFKEGMNWDNYGKWHVDHIRPCVSYNLYDDKQREECFSLSNLQPLWKNENITKSSDGYIPARYLIKELIKFKKKEKPSIKTEDDLFIHLNIKFENDHPPMFYNYIYNGKIL